MGLVRSGDPPPPLHLPGHPPHFQGGKRGPRRYCRLTPPPLSPQGVRHTSKAGSVGLVLSGDLNCKPASLEAALLRALLPGLRWG